MWEIFIIFSNIFSVSFSFLSPLKLPLHTCWYACVLKIYKESEDMPWIRRKYLQIIYLINTYMRIKSSCNLFGKQIISFNVSKILEYKFY